MSSERWKPPEAEGECPTGKIRYASEAIAADSLTRVRARRDATKPDEHGPERDFYECPYCQGWHLTSRARSLEDPEPLRKDGETWQVYALRLEKRIKEQRDQLERINELRADAGNRAERRRIELLTYALGRLTLRLETTRRAKAALVEAIIRLQERINYLLTVPQEEWNPDEVMMMLKAAQSSRRRRKKKEEQPQT